MERNSLGNTCGCSFFRCLSAKPKTRRRRRCPSCSPSEKQRGGKRAVCLACRPSRKSTLSLGFWARAGVRSSQGSAQRSILARYPRYFASLNVSRPTGQGNRRTRYRSTSALVPEERLFHARRSFSLERRRCNRTTFPKVMLPTKGSLWNRLAISFPREQKQAYNRSTSKGGLINATSEAPLPSERIPRKRDL